METTFDAVVLANGDFPRHDVPRQVLHDARLLVCCDGAVARVGRADAVVGDGDSVPPRFRRLLTRVDEQEDNDLTKATRYCISRLVTAGPPRIAYLGCTGGREDHTLGNIALIVRYRRQMGVEPVLFTDTGWFVVGRGRQRFASFPRQQVSLFNFGCRRIGSEGLRWSAYAYDELWQGTLNEALAGSFTVDADGLYLVYRTYEPKENAFL